MKFPKTLYVTKEGEKPEEFLATHEDPAEAAQIGETREIAVYELKELGTVYVNVEVHTQ